MMTSDDKQKRPKKSEWVCKALGKEVGFDLEHTKETFMEVKKNFIKASTSGSQDNLSKEIDPSMLTTFLGICMKLFHDRKSVKGIQELINKFFCKEMDPKAHHTIRKIGIQKKRIGSEMRITTQIREHAMDQVILDLGSDRNVFPK